MGYESDWKSVKAETSTFHCPNCHSDDVWYREWEDSEGHEDYHYECRACDKSWWAEGADS